MDAKSRKQPASDECTQDTNDEISDDPKPGAFGDLTGEPTGNEADHQYDDEAFI